MDHYNESLFRKCLFCKEIFGCETKAPNNESATKTSDGCKSESINIECRKCDYSKYEENVCKVEDLKDNNFTTGLCTECIEKYKASRNKKTDGGVPQK